jgi:hypothetical protein
MSNTRLSPDEQRGIAQALESVGATLPCPRCGYEAWKVLDGYLLENTQSQLRNLVISGDNRLVCVATVCGRCGCLTQHVMDVLQESAATSDVQPVG